MIRLSAPIECVEIEHQLEIQWCDESGVNQADAK